MKTMPLTSIDAPKDLMGLVEKLRVLARDLNSNLVDADAPAKYLSYSKMMSESAQLLSGDVALFDGELEKLNSTRRHDLRNRLHQISGALQRLMKLDSQYSFGQLQQQLIELLHVYEGVQGLLEKRSAEVVCDVPSPLPTNTVLPVAKDTFESKGSELEPDSNPLELREKGRVLIVDDDWQACSLLEETIEDEGHIALSCRKPKRALDMLREGAFDICLVDLNMPTMSGWELLKQIKSDPKTKHVSVIVVSGSIEDDGTTRAIEMGADDFINKPVNFSLLKARVTNCLARSRQHLRELTRFLPVSVVESIRKHPDRLQQGQEATVTVMFCDIRRFSKFSERLSPSETIRWISDVMGNLSQTILDEGGTLVDFVGDEVMSMWGAPQPRGDHAEAACRTALKIQKVVRELSRKWHDVLGDDMEVGIGIHSGIVSVGNTGSPQRFKYGPLGNTVNLGSRVQGASKYLKTRILITKDTYRQIPTSIATRRLCSVRVNNIDRPVELFELTTEMNAASKKRDQEYQLALKDFERRALLEATIKLGKLLANHPDDGPSLLLMKRVIEAKFSGDTDFDPIWTMPGK